jgi:hypothetical protein
MNFISFQWRFPLPNHNEFVVQDIEINDIEIQAARPVLLTNLDEQITVHMWRLTINGVAGAWNQMAPLGQNCTASNETANECYDFDKFVTLSSVEEASPGKVLNIGYKRNNGRLKSANSALVPTFLGS